MIIGVPKEVKDHETRVGLVPSGVAALREAGHDVLVETHAGEGSSIPDEEYTQAGGQILQNAEAKFGLASRPRGQGQRAAVNRSILIFGRGWILFTLSAPGSFAGSHQLTTPRFAGQRRSLRDDSREETDSLPLLTPMSEVAGRMSVQVGAQYLEKPSGGRGILLGGVPGAAPANVVILGGGIVGTQCRPRSRSGWAHT